MKYDTFLRTLFSSLIAAVVLVLATGQIGCKKEKAVEHGAGQRATIKEKEEQNRNLITQVVQATEELEKHPDPVYLRNAVGRLDSWLEKQPVSEHYVQDPDYAVLEKNCKELGLLLRDSDRIYRIFTIKGEAVPSEQDGEKLIANLDKIITLLQDQEKILTPNVYRNFGNVLGELSKRLKETKEFQFGNHVEMIGTVLQKFELPPFYQFGSVAQIFETLSDLFHSDLRSFSSEDADYLKQTVWFRNIAHWAKGNKQDDLQIAKNLFDWTTQNVPFQMIHFPGPLGPIPQQPWQTLLLSQGNSLERAIVFMELLRQNRMDSFILRPAGKPSASFPLLVGVRINSECYLFLPDLGLPIPGKEGITFDKGIQYPSIATLSEVLADDSLLRRMDLSEKEKFPLSSKDLADLIALVPTNPFNMSERMRLMESEFSGEFYTVLATSFAQQKERIRKLNGIKKVDHLWEAYTPLIEQLFFPMESGALIGPYLFSMKEGASIDPQIKKEKTDIQDDPSKKSPLRDTKALTPPLWVGKVLYFKGAFTNENGAAYWLQQGRTSDRRLKQVQNELGIRAEQFVRKVQEESAQQGKALSPTQLQTIGGQFVQKEQQTLALMIYVKTTARFYLALVSHAAGNEQTAASHLGDPSLLYEINGLWRPGALYLLARIDENSGKTERAVALYENSAGPMQYGQKVRAKWIKEKTGLNTALKQEP
ncbi:MAG: hypothetical protein Q4G69_12865, partial [Planctomycetia bacterium]|nr:hypothetical protein [Planctomycetia bacterium]